MKRKNIIPITLFLFVSVITFTAAAQNQKGPVTPFTKGSTTVNFGVGFGADYKNDFSGNTGFGTKAAMEFGLWHAGPGVISLGPEVGVSFANEGRYHEDNFKSHTFVVAGRSAWHYGWKVAGLDTYFGLCAGAGFYHHEYDNGNNHHDYNDAFPVFGGFAGVSYFFTPSFGVNAEAGYDITTLQGGLIFKIR